MEGLPQFTPPTGDEQLPYVVEWLGKLSRFLENAYLADLMRGLTSTTNFGDITADSLTISGTLGVTGAVTMSDTLEVTGTATLSTADVGVVIADTITAGTGAAAGAGKIVDISSTTLALSIPVMTTTQRDNVASPADGMIIMNTTTNRINFYITGSGWIALAI